MQSGQGVEGYLLKSARFFILTNLFIAAGAVAFGMANALLLGLPLESLWILWLHIGSATWMVYQLSRWAFHQRALEAPIVDDIYLWLEKYRGFTKLSILVSAILMAGSFFMLQTPARWALVALGAIALLYPLELPISGRKNFRLRDLPFVKIFLIAMVWAGMAVILPLVEQSGWSAIGEKELQLLGLQLIYILLITLPFDINDWRIDRMTGVKTIPNVLGIPRSKRLVGALSLLYIAGISLWIWQYLETDSNAFLLIIGVGVLLAALYYMTLRYSSSASKWKIMLWFDGSFFWYWLLVALTLV
jgi:4-hydroxybenzoate polyprenyltransferase